MKVAIATENGQVSAHFGHCPHYQVYEVQDNKVIGTSSLPNPGHQPGVLPRFLASHDVNCIIAGGMGPRAVELFEQNRIKVIVGATGNIEEVISKYLDGTLELGESACDHPEQ